MDKNAPKVHDLRQPYPLCQRGDTSVIQAGGEKTFGCWQGWMCRIVGLVSVLVFVLVVEVVLVGYYGS